MHILQGFIRMMEKREATMKGLGQSLGLVSLTRGSFGLWMLFVTAQ